MKATFGGGCFWGVEESFREIKGVRSTQAGYMGGKMKNPAYEDVCTDRTGHVEVVEVEYDPKTVKYEELLEVFWSIHDPTQVNQQGPDHGTHYRSVIFYHNEAQKKAAEKSKEKLQKSEKFKARKTATAIEPAKEFYRAEEYHQNFLAKRGWSTCHF